MPLLTPSRIVSGVLSLIFLTLLWRYGMPDDISAYKQPILGHDDNPHFPLSKDKTGGDLTSQHSQVDQQSSSTLDPNAAAATQIPQITPNTPCRDVRGASDVLIVLRTSKAELEKSKLPAHLTKLLSCAPNVAIYSDHTGTTTILDTKIPIHDALDTIAQKTKAVHDEFREYDKMKADKTYTTSSRLATALDKWKFFPMVYKAYTTTPTHRFYLFIETDTSIAWTNLLQWLDRLDPRIHYYAGAPATTTTDTKVRYAQSAPGILLSWGALRRYAKSYQERYAAEWESYVGKESRGEVMLANAMYEAGVEFVSAFPILQPESPSTLEWTERHWCAPIISWVRPEERETEALQRAQDKWTVKRGWGTPFLARDAFEEVLLPKLSKRKTNWDNLAADTVIKGEPGWKVKQAQKEKEEKERREKEERERKADQDRKKKEEEEKVAAEKARLQKEAEAEAREKEREKEEQRLNRRDTTSYNSTSRSIPNSRQTLLTIRDAASSLENCEAICHATRDCLQWRYTSFGDGECHLGRHVRLGRATQSTTKSATSQRSTSHIFSKPNNARIAEAGGDDGIGGARVGKDKNELQELKNAEEKQKEWTSGWIVDRIQKVTTGWKVCERADWRFNG